MSQLLLKLLLPKYGKRVTDRKLGSFPGPFTWLWLHLLLSGSISGAKGLLAFKEHLFLTFTVVVDPQEFSHSIGREVLDPHGAEPM